MKFCIPYFFLTCWVVVGCSVDRTVVDGDRVVVGPQGGSFQIKSVAVKLTIPAGAVDESTELVVRTVASSAVPKGGIAETTFSIEPADATLFKPINVELAYPIAKLNQSDRSWLRLVKIEGDKFEFTKRVATIEQNGMIFVSATINQLGLFALADLRLAEVLFETNKNKRDKVDVLVVVDNSDSMDQEQQNLRANFSKFIDKLEASKLNYRIGVVTTDLGAGNFGHGTCEKAGGDGGKLIAQSRQDPNCVVPTDPWVERNGSMTNVPGDDVKAAFSCLANLGTGGCAFEHQLESAYRALDGTLNINPGFLRDDAALGVIYLTDEDDCSAQDAALFDPSSLTIDDPLGPLNSFRCTDFGIECDGSPDFRKPGVYQGCKPKTGKYLYDIDRYVAQLKQLKPGGGVFVSLIAGPVEPFVVSLPSIDGDVRPTLEPSCSSPVTGKAVPSIRLNAFLKNFGGAGVFTPICNNDFGAALSQLGSLAVEQTQMTWCLPYKPIDTDPTTPTLDSDCIVVAQKAGPISQCIIGNGDMAPCYEVVTGVACGASDVKLQLRNLTVEAAGESVYAVCLAAK